MRHQPRLVHHRDIGATLCGEEGPSSYTNVTCPECLELLRLERKKRMQEASAQLEINRILKRRQDKQVNRVNRIQARRQPQGG